MAMLQLAKTTPNLQWSIFSSVLLTDRDSSLIFLNIVLKFLLHSLEPQLCIDIKFSKVLNICFKQIF